MFFSSTIYSIFLLWKSLFFVLLSIYIEIYIKLYLKIMCGKFIGWFYYECCYWLKGSECNIGSKRTHFCILFLFWCKIKTFLWALKERNWFLNMYYDWNVEWERITIQSNHLALYQELYYYQRPTVKGWMTERFFYYLSRVFFYWQKRLQVFLLHLKWYRLLVWNHKNFKFCLKNT